MEGTGIVFYLKHKHNVFSIHRQEETALTSLTNYVHHGMIIVSDRKIFIFLNKIAF